MLGFLLSGFLMSFLGLSGGSLALESIADMGIMLLLFTIGLKLDLRGLAKAEIWGGATIHAVITIVLLSGFIIVGGMLGISLLLLELRKIRVANLLPAVLIAPLAQVALEMLGVA